MLSQVKDTKNFKRVLGLKIPSGDGNRFKMKKFKIIISLGRNREVLIRRISLSYRYIIWFSSKGYCLIMILSSEYINFKVSIIQGLIKLTF